MHLTTLLLPLATLATTVAADAMTVHRRWAYNSNAYDFSGASEGIWHSAYGHQPINAAPGCRDNPIPGMTSMCLDYDARRGHFYFSGQGKRCLRIFAYDASGMTCSFDNRWICGLVRFEEVECNW
ncbi:hypothetical protein OQA88_10737 [Cercophora sp. LCS_1]